MAFTVGHVDGSGEPVTLADLGALYDELRDATEEHPCVWVADAQGFCLSAYAGGVVVFEHLDRGGERHMAHVPRERVLEPWARLLRGDRASIDLEPWAAGYE